MTKKYYSVPELAAKLGLTKQALYKAINEGRLEVEMVGTIRLVPVKEAKRWSEARKG